MVIPVRVLTAVRWLQGYTAACFRMNRHLQMNQSSSSLSASGPALPGLSSPELCLSPNVTQYSSSIYLYSDPSIKESDRSSRPLLLLLPWLGSKAKALEKYIQLYFKLGFDVLVAESSLSHFLWPKRGLTYAGQLQDLLTSEKDLSSRSLFIHAMSIGGYTFAQMLVSTSKGTENQKKVLERFHGQVYDSLVIGSMEKMAKGVAGMLSFRVLQTLVASGILLYFRLLKSQTSDYYDNAIQIFKNAPVTCPALIFYCMNDSLSDHVAVEKLVADWEKLGLEVQSKKWKDSVHAGHLRRHPQEYTDILNNFIRSCYSKLPRSKL